MMIFRQRFRTACRQDGARMLTGLLIAAAAAVLLAMPAFAQDTGQQTAKTPKNSAAKQPGWIKICGEVSKGKPKICVVRRAWLAANGQTPAAISLREVKDKKILVVEVPPGVMLKPGVSVQIDGSKPRKVVFTICFPNRCFADVEVNADYVTAMKRGNNLVVTTLTAQAKPIKFNISLIGFTNSYDGEAIDPKKLQEDQKKLQEELKRKAEEARKQLIKKQQETRQ